MNNLLSGLSAYHFLPKKPYLQFEDIKQDNQQLLIPSA